MTAQEKRRVLHVLNELRHSGAEVMLLGSIGKLAERGIETAVVATASSEGPLAPAFRAAGCDVFHVAFKPRPGYLVALLRTARRYDVVHVHAERASFWVCLAIRMVRRPVVRTVHSMFTFRGRLRMVRALQRRLLERLGVRFVAIGYEVARNERERFGINPCVITNWADSRFAESRWSPAPPRERFVVASVGNCGEPKNHDALIDAIGQLRRAGVVVEYQHIGDESGAVVDEREAARRAGVEDVVRFCGAQNPVTALKGVDLFVMPSTREGFGLAALEAMTLGVPTLLADIEGLHEFRDVPGVMWAAPRPHDLAAAISRLAAEPQADRAAAAAEARCFVRQRYSQSASLEALASHYLESARR